MGPAPNICFLFQFGECKHEDSHRNEIGELQLHVCQPCVQLRNILVEHPPQLQHQRKKFYGAIACPHGVSGGSQSLGANEAPVVINPPVTITTEVPPTCRMCNLSKCTCEKYRHPPSIKCYCNQCDYFFSNLQDEIKDCPSMNFDHYEDYKNIH